MYPWITALAFLLAVMATALALVMRWRLGRISRKFQELARVAEMQRHRLAMALDSGRIGTWTWDVNEAEVEWDELYRQQFGFAAGRYRGPLVESVSRIHEDDRAEVMERVGLSQRSRVPFRMEYRVIRAEDGAVTWVRATGMTQYDERTGAPARMFGTIMDITEYKTIESRLRQSVAARDEFLSLASHELKTPLTSLKLQADVTVRQLRGQGAHPAESATPPPNLERYSETLSSEVGRLAVLVEDMLDISRIQAQRLRVHPVPLRVVEPVRRAVARMAPQLELAGCGPCRVLTDEAAEALEACWDPGRVEQVLTNLLSNALKYGRGKPVEVRLSAGPGSAVISVRDHGRGIAEADRARIFEKFERAVSETEIAGLGLGLFIVRELVRLHGGRVSVESRVGEGATFTVELPLRYLAMLPVAQERSGP